MIDHTPTPWFHRPKFTEITGAPIRDVSGAILSKHIVARVSNHNLSGGNFVAAANAAFIVRAANCHDDLVAALRGLVKANDDVQTVLCDGPDVPGFDPSALGRAQWRVTEAEAIAHIALAKAEASTS